MIRWAAVLVLLCLLPVAHAAPWMARVVSVHDGDTVTVLRNRQSIKIRLQAVDAPELDQPFGKQSRRALSALCFDRIARVYPESMDKYGRTLARLECNGIEANAEQLRRGWAWFYAQYSNDSELQSLETEARNARLGLWAYSHPQPPWEFRHGESESRQAVVPIRKWLRILRPQRYGSCGAKNHCSQMKSCTEAYHYLRDCGLAALDGNHDGIPCESLCSQNTGRR